MRFEPQFQNFPGRLLDPPIKGSGRPPPPYDSDKPLHNYPLKAILPQLQIFGSTLLHQHSIVTSTDTRLTLDCHLS